MEAASFFFFLLKKKKIERTAGLTFSKLTKNLLLKILFLLDNYWKNELGFDRNSSFYCWINFRKIDQSRSKNAVNPDGVVSHGILRKLRFEADFRIGKNGNFYFDGIELRIQSS